MKPPAMEGSEVGFTLAGAEAVRIGAAAGVLAAGAALEREPGACTAAERALRLSRPDGWSGLMVTVRTFFGSLGVDEAMAGAGAGGATGGIAAVVAGDVVASSCAEGEPGDPKF